ncbi:MAG: integrase arm-type DNA-binding domain-containing protein [Chitinophagales bacterium]|nr:integrase arm-type DNA-binding domain-containing protein [Chitinophagales bacterium]
MLSDRAITNAKSQAKPYKLSDSGGLYLLVNPNGSKYWRLKYRVKGKEQLYALGVYPLISLKDARRKRDALKKLISEGLDPKVHEKQQQEIEADQSLTFKSIAIEWHEQRKAKLSDGYHKEIMRQLENNVFPVFGEDIVSSIKPPTILKCIRIIEERNALDMAKRMLQYINQVFRYARNTGRIEINPASDMRDALKGRKRRHFAAFTYKELPDFLKILEENRPRLFRQTVLATKLLLLTFVRTSELINATWNEFDLENNMWTIPAQRMKMRQPHQVPLSRQTLSILNELRSLYPKADYILPSVFNWQKPISNNTVLKGLERLGYKGKMTGHGFRALALSTIKQKLGYRHEVVDRQLAHAPKNNVDKAYDRADFIEERIIMMQDWADYIDKLKEL